MAAFDNRYSLLVSWLKILLPLAAIALLSTLFLFSRGRELMEIPIAELEEIARENRLSAPNFSGVAEDGTRFSLSADTARPLPDMPDVIAIEGIALNLEGRDSLGIDVTAGVASFDTSSRIARIEGLARIASTDGYRMETLGIEAQLDQGTLDTIGALEMRAPFGAVTAGHLSVKGATGGSGLVMVFNEGVRLVYQPEQ